MERQWCNSRTSQIEYDYAGCVDRRFDDGDGGVGAKGSHRLTEIIRRLIVILIEFPSSADIGVGVCKHVREEESPLHFSGPTLGSTHLRPFRTNLITVSDTGRVVKNANSMQIYIYRAQSKPAYRLRLANTARLGVRGSATISSMLSVPKRCDDKNSVRFRWFAVWMRNRIVASRMYCLCIEQLLL